MKKVQLKYFKESGKYYCDGEYSSMLDFDFQVYDEVRGFNKVSILPGLSSGHWDGLILVLPESGVPAIIQV